MYVVPALPHMLVAPAELRACVAWWSGKVPAGLALTNDREEICRERPSPPLAVAEEEGISPVFNAPMRAR